MKLRDFIIEDAKYMLEWMHDEDVVRDLRGGFMHKTLDDCITFIDNSTNRGENLHMAIVDNDDTYMGTVSLKNINFEYKYAEFGITVRRKAMGKGYSKFGMKEILDIGFNDLQLNCIYWCVSKSNIRANRFYQKNNYQLTDYVPDSILVNYVSDDNLCWYSVSK